MPLQAQKHPQVESSVNVFGAGANFEPSRDADDPVRAKYQPEDTAPEKRRGEFAVAPIPMINPTIGNGGGGVALYAIRLGGSPIPSTFAGGGFATGNGSWGAGFGGKLSLRADHYRITFGARGGVFNYNFYGIGSSAGNTGLAIPLSQSSRAFLIEPKIRVPGHWFLGPRYHIVHNSISLNRDRLSAHGGQVPTYPLPVPLPAQDLNVTTAALGIRAQGDTTTNAFYPRSGSIFDITADFFSPAFGAQRNYRQFTVIYDRYFGFGQKNVLVHGIVCSSSADAPFFMFACSEIRAICAAIKWDNTVTTACWLRNSNACANSSGGSARLLSPEPVRFRRHSGICKVPIGYPAGYWAPLYTGETKSH